MSATTYPTNGSGPVRHPRAGRRRTPGARGPAGLGTGSLRESYDALTGSGGRVYLSRMSSKARGISDEDLEGTSAEFSTPQRLVELTFEADRSLVY